MLHVSLPVWRMSVSTRVSMMSFTVSAPGALTLKVTAPFLAMSGLFTGGAKNPRWAFIKNAVAVKAKRKKSLFILVKSVRNDAQIYRNLPAIQNELQAILVSCVDYILALTRSHAWEPKRKHSRIVPSMTVKRLMGMVRLNSSLPTHGLTDGSNSPRKQR